VAPWRHFIRAVLFPNNRVDKKILRKFLVETCQVFNWGDYNKIASANCQIGIRRVLDLMDACNLPPFFGLLDRENHKQFFKRISSRVLFEHKAITPTSK